MEGRLSEAPTARVAGGRPAALTVDLKVDGYTRYPIPVPCPDPIPGPRFAGCRLPVLPELRLRLDAVLGLVRGDNLGLQVGWHFFVVRVGHVVGASAAGG